MNEIEFYDGQTITISAKEYYNLVQNQKILTIALIVVTIALVLAILITIFKAVERKL